MELHGDRAGLDDPAIVCGIGSMDGLPFMFIGQQKGRNTKVRGAFINWKTHILVHRPPVLAM